MRYHTGDEFRASLLIAGRKAEKNYRRRKVPEASKPMARPITRPICTRRRKMPMTNPSMIKKINVMFPLVLSGCCAMCLSNYTVQHRAEPVAKKGKNTYPH